MKTWIALDKTVLDFPKVIWENNERTLVMVPQEKRFKPEVLLSALPRELRPIKDISVPGKPVLEERLDFCTVIQGWDKITDDRWKALCIDTMALEDRQAPVFTVPDHWTMAHVMKALGAFKSVGDAKRNGWDKPIEEGHTDHQCRIDRLRGVVLTFRPTKFTLQPGSWESCSDENQ